MEWPRPKAAFWTPEMDVTFATKKLQKLCNSDKNLRKEYGPLMAEVIQRRLFDLEGAECLEVMKSLPGSCHELRANLKGHLALHLVQPNRLVFKPTDEPLPLSSGALIWAEVRRVEIVAIGDYH